MAAFLGLFLLAACSNHPLTPEEQRAMELESYCRGQAEDEASQHLAQKEQSEVDNVGESDPGWEDATAGSDQASKSEAAFAECMRKNAPE